VTMNSALLRPTNHPVGPYDLLVFPKREHAQETVQVVEPDLGDSVLVRPGELVRRLRLVMLLGIFADVELDLGLA
jgi:hypothetical protein